MLNWYAHDLMCSKEILLFRNMVKQGVTPNGEPFSAVFSACSHAGWVNEGMKYLHLMKESYNRAPTIEHFTYVVDLLGQSGLIQEAEEVIKKCHLSRTVLCWTVFNIYSGIGRWEEKMEVRRMFPDFGSEGGLWL